MKLCVGGVHTTIEQANLRTTLRRQLSPIVVVVEFLPRSEDKKIEHSARVHGASADGFIDLQEKIDRALAMNARYNYVIERQETGLSNQFHYVRGDSEAAAQVALAK